MLSKNCTDVNSAAKLIASIIITENLLPNAFVYHVYSMQLLAFCKNAFNEYLEDCVNKTVLVEIAINVLKIFFNSDIELKIRIIF